MTTLICICFYYYFVLTDCLFSLFHSDCSYYKIPNYKYKSYIDIYTILYLPKNSHRSYISENIETTLYLMHCSVFSQAFRRFFSVG